MNGSLTYPQLIAEELCSAQPMIAEAVSSIFRMDNVWEGPLYDYDDHKLGDGMFCECWGRCYICHPMTKEELDAPKVDRIEFKKVKLP